MKLLLITIIFACFSMVSVAQNKRNSRGKHKPRQNTQKELLCKIKIFPAVGNQESLIDTNKVIMDRINADARKIYNPNRALIY